MENFMRSPLGQSLADKFRKAVSPSQKVTHALSDVNTNSPTTPKLSDARIEKQTETRSEPQPETNPQRKKILPELSPQSTPNAKQIEDAVRKAFEAEVSEGVKSRQNSVQGSYIFTCCFFCENTSMD